MYRGIVVIAGVLAAVAAQAAPIDAAKSSVSSSGKQLGVPVTGTFKKVSGDVSFDASKLATSTAHIDVDVTSYDMGLPEYNKNILSAEWFDAAKFPKASFVSSSIKGAGTAYTVSGKLTLKGKVQSVSFPVTIKTVGTTQQFDGALTVKRTAFGVGSGDWADTSVVADDVVIKFHVIVPVKK